MSGYKRVNFFELCRLCSSNQQKEKTHIFREEGRNLQLQNKIQTCLSLNVFEDDPLPKVICDKCMKSLEICHTFKKECVLSESMLSSYFKNFRYTEDFKKSGKVYIKDTTPKIVPQEDSSCDVITTTTSAANSCTNNSMQTSNPVTTTTYSQQNISIVDASAKVSQQIEHIPYYTVQIPTTIVSNPQLGLDSKLKSDINAAKIIQQANSMSAHQTPLAYNLNAINLGTLKSLTKLNSDQQQQPIGNVVVNANGEVINIVDLESIVTHSTIPKMRTNNTKTKKLKERHEEPIVKIDLTGSGDIYETQNPSLESKLEKLPHKTQNANKFQYATVKVDEKALNLNTSLLYNTTDFNQNSNLNSFSNFNNIYQAASSIGIVNQTSNICQTSNETSTVNLNAISDMSGSAHASSYRNFNAAASVAKGSASVLQNNSNKSNSASAVVTSEDKNIIEKSHICEVCLKGFKRREHLYQHIKLHTGFRPYTCENCNKSFMRKEHLLRHMTSHSGQKNFTCNICDKSFSRNDNLLKHKKTHEKQSTFTCEVCQKQFVMQHYYLAHRGTHDIADVVGRCPPPLGVLKA